MRLENKHKVFFISDLHLGHQNIIKFAPQRQRFKSTLEMGEYLIEKWNSVVSSQDKVFVLGDVALNLDEYHQEARSILQKLNGRLFVVKGNHDVGPQKDKFLDGIFEEALGCFEFKDAICTHIPIHPQQLQGSPDGVVYKKWKWNFHGHLHHFPLEPLDKRYINVCCELVDFTPKTYEELTDGC